MHSILYMPMQAKEPVIYITEQWDRYAIPFQNAVDNDAALLAAADFAQRTNLQYTSPAEAQWIQNQDARVGGNILGKVIYPMTPENMHVENTKTKLLMHRVKRFAVVVYQDENHLEGEIHFVPLRTLKDHDPGSLSTLSFPKVVKMIEQAGGNRESISEALAAIPTSAIWSNERNWKDRGGQPHRQGATKRNRTSYHFKKYPAHLTR